MYVLGTPVYIQTSFSQPLFVFFLVVFYPPYEIAREVVAQQGVQSFPYPIQTSILILIIMRTVFLWALAALPAIHATKISHNGRCGVGFGTCQGSSYGNCCSQYGYCGSTPAYCSVGCQSGFGSCSSSRPSSSRPCTSSHPSPSPSAPANKVSKDGTCGGAKGYTCLSSAFGNCCSQYGYW